MGTHIDAGELPERKIYRVADVLLTYFTRKMKTLMVAGGVCLLFLVTAVQSAIVTDKVFFDMTIGGKPAGRIVIGLFGHDVPKTAANFLKLAQGYKGKSYKGTKILRVIPQFMMQGGDVLKNDGTGSMSIYGKKFADENFSIKHNKPYMVTMANVGPNTNGSQFFITFTRTSWLDGKHVAFGEVIQGLDVLKKIEKVGSMTGRPTQAVVIANSGSL